jgi:hypothetical protein
MHLYEAGVIAFHFGLFLGAPADRSGQGVITFHISVAKEVICCLPTSPNEVTKYPATSLREACLI